MGGTTMMTASRRTQLTQLATDKLEAAAALMDVANATDAGMPAEVVLAMAPKKPETVH